MKKKFVLALAGCLFIVGCNDGASGSVAEDASLSEVEEYRKMLEESEKAAEQGASEAAANEATLPKG